MIALTRRQHEILAFIAETNEKGSSPTMREIGERFGIASTNCINGHLRALERKGALEIGSRIARARTVTAFGYSLLGRPKPGGTMLPTPAHGSVRLPRVTDRQLAVLAVIVRANARGEHPTMSELGQGIGLKTKQGVKDHLYALERKGLVENPVGKVRSLRVTSLGVRLFRESAEPPPIPETHASELAPSDPRALAKAVALAVARELAS